MTTLRHLGYSVITAVVLLIATTGIAHADLIVFEAILAGTNEVPSNASPATGSATIILDTESGLTFPVHLEFTGLMGTQTGAHIHIGAAGTNGPVRLALPMGSPSDTTINWGISDSGNAAGEFLYANVHTTAFPDGEIRGQFISLGTVADEASSWGGIKAIFR